jgi:hypothetical protein
VGFNQAIKKCSRFRETVAFVSVQCGDNGRLCVDQCVKAGDGSLDIGEQLQIPPELVLFFDQQLLQSATQLPVGLLSESIAEMPYVGPCDKAIHGDVGCLTLSSSEVYQPRRGRSINIP